jgi:hypothetical protein
VGHPKIDQPERAANTAVVSAMRRGKYLPLLLQTAGAISADWAACQAAPQIVKAGDGRVSAERTG